MLLTFLNHFITKMMPNFWHLHITPILKIQLFPLGVLIFRKINLNINCQKVKFLLRQIQIYDNIDNYLELFVHKCWKNRSRTSIWQWPTTTWLQTASALCRLPQVFWFCWKCGSRWTVEWFGFLWKIIYL